METGPKQPRLRATIHCADLRFPVTRHPSLATAVVPRIRVHSCKKPFRSPLPPFPPVKSPPIPTESKSDLKIYFSSPMSDFGLLRPPPKIKNYQTNPFSGIHNPITFSVLRKLSRPAAPKTNPFSTPWLPPGYHINNSLSTSHAQPSLCPIVLDRAESYRWERGSASRSRMCSFKIMGSFNRPTCSRCCGPQARAPFRFAHAEGWEKNNSCRAYGEGNTYEN